MAFQLSPCREAIYKNLLWAFYPFDLECGVFGSHTCFKAHTTSKGIFSFSQCKFKTCKTILKQKWKFTG